MDKKKLGYLVVLCFAAWCVAILQWNVLETAAHNRKIKKEKAFELVETERFRKMQISKEWLDKIEVFSEENRLEPTEVLAYYMVENDFELTDREPELQDVALYSEKVAKLKESRAEAFENVRCAYSAIFGDVEYFPIPASSSEYPIDVSFCDGWGNERCYNDEKHLHEGTDIMTNHGRGYVPIVSITAGVVENVGWLELGGYRIGIRSENGGYFYYAHLYKYSRNFEVGDTVKAGELIGFMGDSGYGKTEGTIGRFDVHLHLGIYIKTKNYEELSINPYIVLRYLNENRILYNMQGE